MNNEPSFTVCKHGCLRRKCELCDYHELIASIVPTTIVGFNLSDSTVLLKFPREKSIIGMTTGQVIEVVITESATGALAAQMAVATMNNKPMVPTTIVSSAWFGADVVKPETFNSVIVWGLLEDEYQLDSHEGFWCGLNWWSVRQDETDPMEKKKLSDVTHWMPRPQAPNDTLCREAGQKDAR